MDERNTKVHLLVKEERERERKSHKASDRSNFPRHVRVEENEKPGD